LCAGSRKPFKRAKKRRGREGVDGLFLQSILQEEGRDQVISECRLDGDRGERGIARILVLHQSGGGGKGGGPRVLCCSGGGKEGEGGFPYTISLLCSEKKGTLAAEHVVGPVIARRKRKGKRAPSRSRIMRVVAHGGGGRRSITSLCHHSCKERESPAIFSPSY